MLDFSARASPSLRNPTSFCYKSLLFCELFQVAIAICGFIFFWEEKRNNYLALKIPTKSKIFKKVRIFDEHFKKINEHFETSNLKYIENEKIRCNELFSNIDGKVLDEQQKNAVVYDEDNMLVLAGPGTGKTLTIAAKVKYLCDIKKVNPSEILLLAFTNKSAKEMTERISKKLKINVEAKTFHKLGFDIIKSANKQVFDVYENIEKFISEYFNDNIINDPELIRSIVELFAYYINIPTEPSKYSSLGEMYDHEKSMDFETLRSKFQNPKDEDLYISMVAKNRKKNKQTLNGEYVKSLEEVTIANFLFLNGIKYEYEREYPHCTQRYKPDFYLPDYDLYIEHFGINMDNRVPWLSESEEKKYLNGIAWKRYIHEKNNTKLIETYSYFAYEGRLIDELDLLLKNNKVEYKRVDYKDVFERVYIKREDKYFSEFIKLCATFITLFKSAGYKCDQIGSLSYKGDKYSSEFHTKRKECFVSILSPLIKSYEQFLNEKNLVDFSDMINEATKIIKKGFIVGSYKYVIIDEYQDISVARYNLIKAILEQTEAKLFCVGDDCQSIYRFAGSDISLTTDFQQKFGYTQHIKLEKTYRNSQELIDVSGEFITKNPLQISKKLRSSKSMSCPVIFWNYQYNNRKDNKYENGYLIALEKIIDKIILEFGPDKNILFLGRTKWDKELLYEPIFVDESDNTEMYLFFKIKDKIIYKKSPQTPISFLTVHKSKGLEADNVVILNFKNARLGFPNKIIDDPILDLILSDMDEYDYAEERRLFYVALTRTKNRCYVLVDENRPSEFMREFEESKSVHIKKIHKSIDKCPRCKTGNLVTRTNPSSSIKFYGCTNYPRCQYTAMVETIEEEDKNTI